MATTTEDPIRAEVERVLHALVGAAIAGPAIVLTAVPRCVLRRTATMRRRATEPVRIVRSLVELVGGSTRGVISRDDAPDPGAVLLVDGPPPEEAEDDGDDIAAVPSADGSAGAPDDLPIDEYESLAASQVVARLEALTPIELATVRAFELGHRGRRTVLGKIDQLLAPA